MGLFDGPASLSRSKIGQRPLRKQFSPLASGLWHPVGMEKKQPQPDPNSKFAEVKRKAAELRAKKKMVRDEEAQRAEQISRDLSEDDEPPETSRG